MSKMARSSEKKIVNVAAVNGANGSKRRKNGDSGLKCRKFLEIVKSAAFNGLLQY